ncbi:hypothetical protein L861_02510 [Litchfieldella anticariensis FP35 = DSM 16096]|uniref:BioF2-like acetyltransferase domain-containing protein n=1 Tax=Litchfieldella anticariensis (strain DSM 16096 / CECT 5854 / CIP 108499 / LMG 22089 / FP35) TaxID=1121939 RepID=S2KQP0_LITA3|nr:hypothetical protein [Halomonas anticariensis]EPC04205.1 hypothetical protein L861_02510 [Halomonas anticariensis FP35 = DSM 16096]
MVEENEYAGFLEAAGHQVVRMDGVEWYAYQGFMMPAYLPHVVPKISTEQARRLLKASRHPFVRWTCGFDRTESSPWWFVVREGPYSLEQCSTNTRSKIRRGLKRLTVRRASLDEMREQGHSVCVQAAARYDTAGAASLPRHDDFQRRLEAAASYPDVVEYYAVFQGERMVAFSENHLQSKAAFWENIWYVPDSLRDYSSYALTHVMLDDYLNARGLDYVTDGSRSIYHQTQVQNFFIGTFGFTRQFAKLEVAYTPLFGGLITSAYFLRHLLGSRTRGRFPILDKVGALLTQESIRRGC